MLQPEPQPEQQRQRQQRVEIRIDITNSHVIEPIHNSSQEQPKRDRTKPPASAADERRLGKDKNEESRDAYTLLQVQVDQLQVSKSPATATASAAATRSSTGAFSLACSSHATTTTATATVHSTTETLSSELSSRALFIPTYS